MSSGNPCKDRRAHRPHWVVTQRRHNQSAFNGYRVTPSDYSEVRCTAPGCLGVWRTKAAFVDALPDDYAGCGRPAETRCRVCRRPRCQACQTNHHHEGYGTPATDSR
jgi:hypothetical protein